MALRMTLVYWHIRRNNVHGRTRRRTLNRLSQDWIDQYLRTANKGYIPERISHRPEFHESGSTAKDFVAKRQWQEDEIERTLRMYKGWYAAFGTLRTGEWACQLRGRRICRELKICWLLPHKRKSLWYVGSRKQNARYNGRSRKEDNLTMIPQAAALQASPSAARKP
jgi:hypothetical protein